MKRFKFIFLVAVLLPAMFQLSDAGIFGKAKKAKRNLNKDVTKKFNTAFDSLTSTGKTLGETALDLAQNGGNWFVQANNRAWASPLDDGITKGYKWSTNSNTWKQMGKDLKNHATSAYQWARSNIPGFGCITDFLNDGGNFDTFTGCLGIDDEIQCMADMVSFTDSWGLEMDNLLSVEETLIPGAFALFKAMENAFNKSSKRSSRDDDNQDRVLGEGDIDKVAGIMEAVASIVDIQGFSGIDDLVSTKSVPRILPDLEDIATLLDGIVNEMKSIFGSLGAFLDDTFDAWKSEGCAEGLCFSLVLEMNTGGSSGKLRYWSPLVSLSFCLPDQNFVVSIQPVRFKKEEDQKVTLSLKAGSQPLDFGTTNVVNDVQEHVDVVSSQGAWLGLGLKMFTASPALQKTTMGLSGEFRIGLSGIKFQGGISFTHKLLDLYDSSNGLNSPANQLSQPIAASFQKTIIIVFCPWCKEGEDHGRDFEDLSISDITSEADTIPAPSGLIFMIRKGDACLEAYLDSGKVEDGRECDVDNPYQEWAIEGNYIISLYHENKCLTHFHKNSWIKLLIADCDRDLRDGEGNEWEFRSNGAIVSTKDPTICLEGTGSNFVELTVDHSCNPDSSSTTKFWWVTKNFMLSHYEDGGVQCMLASTRYDVPYLSTSYCRSHYKSQFTMTSNGMIYFSTKALTRDNDDRAYWSSDASGGDNQVFSFTVDGKIQVKETQQCLVTASRKEIYEDDDAFARLFFGECDYLGYQKLIKASSYKRFGNRNVDLDETFCLKHKHLGNDESELFMSKCEDFDTYRFAWQLKDGKLISKTADGSVACVEVNVDADVPYVYISTGTCPSNALFSYDYDTFKIKVFAGGEEKCLDASGNVVTENDGTTSTTVILSDCDGRSKSKMWGVHQFITDEEFLQEYAYFSDGYSTVYSPEYGPTMCLRRANQDIVMLEEPGQDETPCSETYWYLKDDTQQLVAIWDGDKRCLDSAQGKLVVCDNSNSISETQKWSYDRATLMVHSSLNGNQRCLTLAIDTQDNFVYLTTTEYCDEEDPMQRFGPSWKPVIFDVESVPNTIKNVERSNMNQWGLDVVISVSDDDQESLLLNCDVDGDSNNQKWMLHTDGSLSVSSDPFSCAMIMQGTQRLVLRDCTMEGYSKTFFYDPETLQLSYNEYDIDDGTITKLCVGYELDNGTDLRYVTGGFDCTHPDGDAGKLQWIF